MGFYVTLHFMSWWKNHEHHKEQCEIVIVEEFEIIVVNEIEYHKHRPSLALTTIIDNQILIMSDVSLAVGGTKNGTLTLIDNKTQGVVPASFSNQSVGANSNPEFATFALDGTDPNQVVGTGIAAGSGTVIITTHADYTDAGDNSSQSADFSVTKNYTVVASPNGSTLDVVFP